MGPRPDLVRGRSRTSSIAPGCKFPPHQAPPSLHSWGLQGSPSWGPGPLGTASWLPPILVATLGNPHPENQQKGLSSVCAPSLGICSNHFGINMGRLNSQEFRRWINCGWNGIDGVTRSFMWRGRCDLDVWLPLSHLCPENRPGLWAGATQTASIQCESRALSGPNRRVWGR